ncbi:hypothetical protein ACIBG8_19345 [Nonomuraea sp. NPDC050556]|uniref:hypothetical protein n=1 Tax=Nonomuraea sp. NPDC050556 TaxID=3364369 RepID=UPI00379AC096
MKAEDLKPGDDIVLWAGPSLGEVSALVRRVEVAPTGKIRVHVDEIEWAVLLVDAGVEIGLADAVL